MSVFWGRNECHDSRKLWNDTFWVIAAHNWSRLRQFWKVWSKYGRVNASKDASFSRFLFSFVFFSPGKNSYRGCLESRGLNWHPDTLEMVSGIKGLCLKPGGVQSVKKTAEKSSGEKKANAGSAPQRLASLIWDFEKKKKKRTLMLVEAKCYLKKTRMSFQTQEEKINPCAGRCDTRDFLLAVVAYRLKKKKSTKMWSWLYSSPAVQEEKSLVFNKPQALSHNRGDQTKRKSSHLIAALEADFRRLAPGLHGVEEDAEPFLLAPEEAEGQRGVPGRLGQRHQPRLGFSGARYVQQSEVAAHFLKRHTQKTERATQMWGKRNKLTN